MSRDAQLPAIAVPIDRCVVVTENHGGYHGGRCIVCDECGWLDNKYGWPYGTPRTNKLVHKQDCPVGDKLGLKVELKP